MKNVVRALVVFAMVPLAACATIVDGQTQSLSVQTASVGDTVGGAQCSLQSGRGTWFVTTPGTVVVHRAANLNVNCSKDGYKPATKVVTAGSNWWVMGNIIFGGLIGDIVDISDGAQWSYPNLITVPMTATVSSAPSKAGSPIS